MTAAKRKLRLVPNAATEQSAGEILALGDATVISDPNSISAALGLYFQWEKKGSCRVALQNAGAKKSFECVMDYDRDEASPSEIKFKLRNFMEKADEIFPGTPLTIRFEVFKARYDFTAPILAASQNSNGEGWNLITDLPQEIRIARSPQLHRIPLTDEMSTKLPQAKWAPATPGTGALSMKILEMGMLSIKAECKVGAEKQGVIQLGDLAIPATVDRVESDGVVFQCRLEGKNIFGSYFDLYRQVAYPCLRSRYELPFEKGINLYSKTKYFSTFNAEKTLEEKQKICETWEAIKGGVHETNADYYVVDNQGEPTGSSGLALTNFSGDKPIWTFHQLCALKNPSLLEQSGILYTWRAEYLAARPEDLSVWGTFRSKSRWLERIYVKHARNSGKTTKLLAVVLRRCNFTGTKDNGNLILKMYDLGKEIRNCTVSQEIWAGVNPRYLNANDNLETIVSVFRPLSVEDLQSIASQFAQITCKENISLVLVLPLEHDLLPLGGKLQVQDRFFVIPKIDLVTFISSVEHSVAVLERKLHSGTVE